MKLQDKHSSIIMLLFAHLNQLCQYVVLIGSNRMQEDVGLFASFSLSHIKYCKILVFLNLKTLLLFLFVIIFVVILSFSSHLVYLRPYFSLGLS